MYFIHSLSYNPIGTEGLKELLPGLLHCKILERLGSAISNYCYVYIILNAVFVIVT